MSSLALVNLGAGTYYGQPTGLLFLASYVKHALPSWEVRIVDAAFEDPYRTLRQQPADVIGISAMTPQYEKACDLARKLKALDLHVILGGVHITSCPGSLRPGFDAVFPGESEDSLVHYLRTSQYAPQPPVLLESYPDLDFSVISRHYVRRTSRVWQDTVVDGFLMTSRGCPFDCRFCATTNFWKKYRAHTPEWIIRQLQAMVNRGVTHIQLWDDMFVVHKPRLRRIAELFEQAGLQHHIKAIMGGTRANVVDDEVCDYLGRMNFKVLGFGFESGSDRVLKYLKKTGSSVAMNKRAALTARRHGIKVLGSMMVGNPTETCRDLAATMRYILWSFVHGVDDIYPYIATPYPGTEFWQIARSRGTVSDGMNFDTLKLRTKLVGNPLLLDIPKWQFFLMFYLVQACLLPFRVRKLFRLLTSLVYRRRN